MIAYSTRPGALVTARDAAVTADGPAEAAFARHGLAHCLLTPKPGRPITLTAA